MLDREQVPITAETDMVLRTFLQVEVMRGKILMHVKFVVGIIIPLLSVFTGGIILTNPHMSYHKH